ncbi:VQ motif-containing protein 22-like [Musa acuminata AAA Group]|uniref:VQ motif-containing protein 22-like n=1 Tax=Musa acuminata AAA Group TaxID=214697 RepID=UPI0031CE4362
MATSDDTSGPAEWVQLGGWPHLLPPPSPLAAPSGCVSDSIVVSTTSSATVDGPAKGAAAQQPGVEGRVSKPVRRRSRASRRTPTTMLNTNTANFRSMVQQFTGIPSGPYSSACRPGGGPISNFGYNFNEPIHQTTSMTLGQLRQQQQQQQQQQQRQYLQLQNHQSQQHQQQQNCQSSMYTASGGNNTSNDVFPQGFNNLGTNLEVGDGFFLNGMYSQMMARPTSTNARGDGYFS